MTEEQSHQAALQVIERARRGGLEALRAMIDDGALISTDEFARRRGWTTLGLHRARGDGRVFSFQVDGRSWFARPLAEMPEGFVAELCNALRPLEPSSRLVFILRRHGGLGGITVLEAFQQGAGDRILELARDLVDEMGGAT